MGQRLPPIDSPAVGARSAGLTLMNRGLAAVWQLPSSLELWASEAHACPCQIRPRQPCRCAGPCRLIFRVARHMSLSRMLLWQMNGHTAPVYP